MVLLRDTDDLAAPGRWLLFEVLLLRLLLLGVVDFAVERFVVPAAVRLLLLVPADLLERLLVAFFVLPAERDFEAVDAFVLLEPLRVELDFAADGSFLVVLLVEEAERLPAVLLLPDVADLPVVRLAELVLLGVEVPLLLVEVPALRFPLTETRLVPPVARDRSEVRPTPERPSSFGAVRRLFVAVVAFSPCAMGSSL